MKLYTAKKIKEFVVNGGFLFAMCSATDSYDIALAAEGVDICETMFDHDPADKNANAKLDYGKSFAFENYKLSMNPFEYEYSTIDTYHTLRQQYAVTYKTDIFTLFEFSAKWDPVPTMLCQNHTTTIQGFWGQTAGFNKQYIKKNVLTMGSPKPLVKHVTSMERLGKARGRFTADTILRTISTGLRNLRPISAFIPIHLATDLFSIIFCSLRQKRKNKKHNSSPLILY